MKRHVYVDASGEARCCENRRTSHFHAVMPGRYLFIGFAHVVLHVPPFPILIHIHTVCIVGLGGKR